MPLDDQVQRRGERRHVERSDQPQTSDEMERLRHAAARQRRRIEQQARFLIDRQRQRPGAIRDRHRRVASSRAAGARSGQTREAAHRRRGEEVAQRDLGVERRP